MSDVEQILYNGREIKPFSIQRASPAIPLPTTTSSPMTSNEINTLSPTAGPEEEAEERDYTTVTSPNENTTFQENLRYETAADILHGIGQSLRLRRSFIWIQPAHPTSHH